jgi:hypothetical protein
MYQGSNIFDIKNYRVSDLEIVVSYCSACNGEIYKGEEVYLIDEDYVHEDCFEEYAKLTLDAYIDYAE